MELIPIWSRGNGFAVTELRWLQTWFELQRHVRYDVDFQHLACFARPFPEIQTYKYSFILFMMKKKANHVGNSSEIMAGH